MSSKRKKINESEVAKGDLVPKLRFPEFRNTPTWEKKKMKDFASFYKGKGVSKSDIYPNGEIGCIRYGELYTRYNEVINNTFSRTDCAIPDLFLSRKNDVILPASGETKLDIARASCVMLDDIALGSDLNIIRSPVNGVFLSYYLNGPLKKDIAKVAQGDSVVHLYASQLKEVEVQIPINAEQQKIADCLSSIDKIIITQAQKLNTLKSHKKALLQNVFPAESETVPRFRFSEFINGSVWEDKELKDFCNITNGRSNAEDHIHDGIYPLFDRSGIIKKSNKFLFDQEAVIIPGEGMRFIPKYFNGKFDLHQRAYILKDFTCVGKYVYYQMDALQNQLAAKAVLSTVLSLRLPILQNFTIKIPTNINEQQKIVDCFSFIDDLIAAQTQKIAALKNHKKGLMQQLFPSLDETAE